MIDVAATAAEGGLHAVSLDRSVVTVQFCSRTAQAKWPIGFAVRHFRNEQNGTNSCIGRTDSVEAYRHTAHICQGTIWAIDSFDQRGTELGKVLAQRIIPEFENKTKPNLQHDSSTIALIRRYRKSTESSRRLRNALWSLKMRIIVQADYRPGGLSSRWIIVQFVKPARVNEACQLIKSTHDHTAIMAKTEQIAEPTHGILHVSAHTNALQSGMPTQFRSRSIFPARQSLQASEGMLKQKELS
jgi:hypothetical protein